MILVRIDGIKGDIKIAGYIDWFAANSIGFGVGRKIETTTSTKKPDNKQDTETGHGDLQDMSIEKSVDSASVDLMYMAMKDRTETSPSKMVSVDIHFIEAHSYDAKREGRGTTTAYLRISLGKALIRNWSIDGSDDERPIESLSLWFNQAAMQYKAYEAPSASNPEARFITYGPKGWDQQTHADWKPPGK